ncbi:hypothetical protein [Agromyces laixinhei]|uniref:hypothetical protein n=1 Tax=Agromyces laixinhei TaxID=2585717 RepID=UPI0012EEAA65|nr:hypothetical protein [Agromyces laixinhei]
MSTALASTSGWTAETASAVIASITRIQPEPATIADQLEHEAHVLNAYAVELEQIRARLQSIRGRRDELESQRWYVGLEMNAFSAPYGIVTGAEAAEQARLERRIMFLTERLADLDRELAALVVERENADSACVTGLTGATVLGSLATFAGSTSATGLLTKLTNLSATDLLVLARAQPGIFEQLRKTPPAPGTVADWWAGLGVTSQAALIAAAPAVIGALNGVPALARVAANQVNAIVLLAASKAELDRLTAPSRERSFAEWYGISQTGGYAEAAEVAGSTTRIEFLKKEIAYLEKVCDGSVQLYLYDRDASRIIEMIGTPSETTTKVVTYVPGTYTSLFDFYKGGVQEVSSYLHDNDAMAVAFVYKDGVFPGENSDTGAVNLARVGEANDQVFGRQSGVTLAAFEDGMRSDLMLGDRDQVAIGHSWGLANITSSEVAGTHYDKVVSLSGAGMLAEWRPDPTTAYSDFSYQDLLQEAQSLDAVWDGNNPRTNPAFEHGEYFRGPDDDILDNAAVTVNANGVPQPTVDARAFGVLMDNHNLITKDVLENRQVLAVMRKWIYE